MNHRLVFSLNVGLTGRLKQNIILMAFYIKCLQGERQQNEMLRKAAQRSIANTGKIPSEREIQSWLRQNKDSYLHKMALSENRQRDEGNENA